MDPLTSKADMDPLLYCNRVKVQTIIQKVGRVILSSHHVPTLVWSTCAIACLFRERDGERETEHASCCFSLFDDINEEVNKECINHTNLTMKKILI